MNRPAVMNVARAKCSASPGAPSPAAAAALQQARASRVFSLVEVAIALVAVGMSLSAMIIPIGQQQRDKMYRSTENKVAAVIDAMLDYAVASTSVSMTGSKPFLPCPVRVLDKVDGLEDRDPDNGACLADSGGLPWKTLGLSPGDTWGTHLTYVVHPAYFNSESGFGSAVITTLHSPPSPLVACRLNGAQQCLKSQDKEHVLSANYPYRDASPPLDEALPEYYNPPLAVASANVFTYDGIPFAIISHGQNSFGGCAVNTEKNIAKRHASPKTGLELLNAAQNQCVVSLQTESLLSELSNAKQAAQHDNMAALHRWRDIRARRSISAHLFSAHAGLEEDFNDVVAWMSRSELIRAIRKSGKFPEHFGTAI